MDTIQTNTKRELAFHYVLISTALILLYTGFYFSQPIITTIGGAFIGASISSVYSRFADKDIINSFGLLSQPQKFTSEESAIKEFRRKWHMYYVNRNKGSYVWRHIVVDFSKATIPGYLNTNEKNENPGGKEYEFNVEAGVRGNKLITIHTIKGKENLIRIFPSINNEAMDGYYFGFVCLTTLDNTRLLGATILADNSLEFGEAPLINDPELMKKLDKRWYEGIKKLNFDLMATPSGLLQVNVNDE
ncbi:hypothetical protein ACSAZL_06440 [Methanosarcina sp. T3]|uniref:hypothetical protein n=1 Tax=Methanosarcina sp. T3 TaxID=3439062 RepID=UPI003F86EC46